MAKEKDEPVKTRNPDLVEVTKDGELMEVHHTCLKAHEKIGWKKTS